MANRDIGGLPPLAPGALERTDQLIILDVSGSETKRIGVNELIVNGMILAGADLVLPPNVIEEFNLADGSVTFPKLDPNIVIDCGTF